MHHESENLYFHTSVTLQIEGVPQETHQQSIGRARARVIGGVVGLTTLIFEFLILLNGAK